jgi:hypothetical protein
MVGAPKMNIESTASKSFGAKAARDIMKPWQRRSR